MTDEINFDDLEEKGGKNVSSYKMPGRPPRKPANKVGISKRCLVTLGVNNAYAQGVEAHGLENDSDYMRLSIYNQLVKDGLMTDALRKDATWDSLRSKGLI